MGMSCAARPPSTYFWNKWEIHMGKRQRNWISVLVLFGGIFWGTRAQAQFLGNPVAFSGEKTLSLGISGMYQNFQWENASFRSKGALGRLSLGLVDGLDIYLWGGYRDLDFSERALALSEVAFGYHVTAGAGFRFRVLGTKIGPFAVHGFAEGLAAGPETYFEQPAPGRPAGTTQRSYVYLKVGLAQGGLVAVFRLPRMDLFLGAAANYAEFRTERDDYLISAARTHFTNSQKSIQESPVFGLVSGGLDFKLPAGYRLSLEIQNSTAPDFRVMVGLSQIGHLKD